MTLEERAISAIEQTETLDLMRILETAAAMPDPVPFLGQIRNWIGDADPQLADEMIRRLCHMIVDHRPTAH